MDRNATRVVRGGVRWSATTLATGILFASSGSQAREGGGMWFVGDLWLGAETHGAGGSRSSSQPPGRDARDAPNRSAVIVRDGRIAAVGRVALARQKSIRGLPRLELPPGAWVLPGLADAHGHLTGLGRSMEDVDLRDAPSAEEAARRVAEQVRALAIDAGAPRRFIVGRGWDQTRWPGNAMPTAAVLSAAVAVHPVFLRRVDGHAAWVNEAALRAANIGKDTPDPPGGKILRAPDGAPSGVLLDHAMDLVASRIPPPTDAEIETRILRAARRCIAAGLTAVHEAGVDGRSLSALERLDAAGKLPLRVYAMVEATDATALEALWKSGPRRGARLTVRAVKVYLDGALGSRGAWLSEPYADAPDPGWRGLRLTPADRFREIVRRARAAGIQVAVHAIGDAAVDEALGVFDAEGVRPADRFRIEHAQVLGIESAKKMLRLGVVASMQPTHATSDMRWAEARLGAERARRAYAWRTLLKAGVRLAFGSDFPVESEAPLLGLHAAVTRQDERGQPAAGWRPEERLDPDEAITAFTSGAAYAAFEESERGRIAPGYRADFTVLDRPVLVHSVQANTARVLYTIVDGEVVHAHQPAGARP